MRTLRRAREAALQILFQREFQKTHSAKDLFDAFTTHFSVEEEVGDYVFFVVTHVMELEEKLCELIEHYSDNWRIDRIALIDKILLQMAIFELCFSTQTPTAPKLCMTDIIDLAKRYSSNESRVFINGILDKIYQEEILKPS